MSVPKNVITNQVPDELKGVVKALARDKAKEAKERRAIDKGVKAAARKVVTGH